MVCMKRVITIIAALAIVAAFAFCGAGCSQSSELVSKANAKLSHAVAKVKELLPESEDSEETVAILERLDSLSLPSLDGISFGKGILSSVEDVALIPTDYYGQYYVFEYDGEEFTAYFNSYSWTIYDSYKSTNHGDIVIICQALLNEHLVYGSDWESYRTAEDMAYEWEQHNIAYRVVPEDNRWHEKAKDVDLDPDDQGKSFQDMYESRTGRQFDIRNYLPW